MMARSSSGLVDLHHASRIMNVKKRRIYDVTNVLEGTGLIQKTGKNKVGWIEGDIQDLMCFKD